MDVEEATITALVFGMGLLNVVCALAGIGNNPGINLVLFVACMTYVVWMVLLAAFSD